MNEREQIIQNYIRAYNQFDPEGMVVDFDSSIQFKNISNGNITLSLKGLIAFKKQAKEALHLFSERTQTIQSFSHRPDETEVHINYRAILAIDLAKGLTKGHELNLEGRSIFRFSGNKIIGLTDIG